MRIERFAPSPTGLLHLGHVYSAALACCGARTNHGKFLLRMEDLDRSRCRTEFYTAIEQDLEWLGLSWDGDVLRQSTRMKSYETALQKLLDLGLLYRCVCTRKDLRDAIAAPQEGADHDADVSIYPGTCKDRFLDESLPHALRLNMSAAIEQLGGPSAVRGLFFGMIKTDGTCDLTHISPTFLAEMAGDVVLKRKDGAPAYHLAVVVDDAFQGITHVTRGEDLFEVTAIHRVLQALLDLPTPVYRHHRLIRDGSGKRLAKRDDARSIRTLREGGAKPADIYRMLEFSDLAAGSVV